MPQLSTPILSPRIKPTFLGEDDGHAAFAEFEVLHLNILCRLDSVWSKELAKDSGAPDIQLIILR